MQLRFHNEEYKLSSTSKVRKKRKWGKIFEYSSHSRQLLMDSENREAAEKDILSMRVVTPAVIASKYDVRVSTAKRLLDALHRRGKLRLVVDSGRLKAYEPVK